MIVYNNVYRYSLSSVGVDNDHDLFVIQNPGKVDAESIHVKAGDDILIGANKDILQVGVFRLHLLEGKKSPMVSSGGGLVALSQLFAYVEVAKDAIVYILC
jgi:hypothetical protein